MGKVLTGPGGGETWCGCDRSAVDDSGHCEKHGWETSPRVTPDVPALAQPEPAAPEVVWEDFGVRVLVDGRVQFKRDGDVWVDGGEGTGAAFGSLARALAAQDMRERAARKLEASTSPAGFEALLKSHPGLIGAAGEISVGDWRTIVCALAAEVRAILVEAPRSPEGTPPG